MLFVKQKYKNINFNKTETESKNGKSPTHFQKGETCALAGYELELAKEKRVHFL